jgi:gluconolactonase
MDLETLAFGYGLLEGPRVDDAGRLYFADVRNGGVFRRDPSGAIETIVPGRKGVGGISLHADGGIVISGRDLCHVKDGRTRVLFGRADIPGWNDLFCDDAGRVLSGTIRSDPFRPGDRTPGELWRVDAEGSARELYAEVGLSNGLGLSPDRRRLYHSDSTARAILVSDLDADGIPRGRRTFATLPAGFPDGLAVDAAGAVWVAVASGGCAVRLAPDGRTDRRLELPARMVTSLCFGGADGRDLYLVTADNTDDPERRGTIFRTRVDVPGLPAPLARI